MGMSFINDNDHDYYLNCSAWTCILRLASNLGWQPAGTQAPRLDANVRDGEVSEFVQQTWNGSYTLNYGQIVTGEDAAHLADALELALQEVNDCPEEGSGSESLDSSDESVFFSRYFQIDPKKTGRLYPVLP